MQRLLATESKWWREQVTKSGGCSVRRTPGREPPVEGLAAWYAKKEARVTAEKDQSLMKQAVTHAEQIMPRLA